MLGSAHLSTVRTAVSNSFPVAIFPIPFRHPLLFYQLFHMSVFLHLIRKINQIAMTWKTPAHRKGTNWHKIPRYIWKWFLQRAFYFLFIENTGNAVTNSVGFERQCWVYVDWVTHAGIHLDKKMTTFFRLHFELPMLLVRRVQWSVKLVCDTVSFSCVQHT